METNKNRAKIFFLLTIFSVIFFNIGYLFGTGKIGFENGSFSFNKTINVLNKEVGKPKEVDFSLFWDAWNKVTENFNGELDSEKMMYGAISGMVSSLGDAYTVFYNGEEAKQLQEELSGSFSGIGAEVGEKDGKIVIIAPLDDTPAQKAGLKPQDEVVAINGDLTIGLTVDQAVSKIRGEAGTKVKLKIKRAEKDLEFEITREKITIKSVKHKQVQGYDVLEISSFNETTAEEFKKAIENIKNTKGIVVDLRSNPGGYLDVSTKIISEFIPKGKLILMQKDKNGNIEETKSNGGGFENIKVVILVNEGTASASEIFAGAVRDNDRGKIIGKKTFGKGTVQTIEELSGGNVLKVTIAKWLTPNGSEINKIGITPDYEVELTEEDAKKEIDPQLNKAIEILSKT